MFKVGQKVLCISDTFDLLGLQKKYPWLHFSQTLHGLTAGKVYTVAETYFPWEAPVPELDVLHVAVKEIIRPNLKTRGYLHLRFKPLNDPAVEIFKKMCQDLDKELETIDDLYAMNEYLESFE